MKKILVITMVSLFLTFTMAETFSLYHFGTVPTTLTCIYLISLFSIIEYLIFLAVYIIFKRIKKEKIELKKIISMILIFLSLILILGFIFMLDIDWLNYYSANSAPFYVNVIVRGIEFLLPSLLLIIVSVYLMRKNN